MARKKRLYKYWNPRIKRYVYMVKLKSGRMKIVKVAKK